ncbi:MAG: GHMP family kinase ATP-binding protein [Candidatus Limnocylindrales bacterium]
MITTASVPGTCGELFQGTLDGEPCLVSCPISVSSSARAGVGVRVGPLPVKVRQALEAVAIPPDRMPHVELTRRLPLGRGYGTSTADLGAAVHAVARAAGRPVDDAEAVRIAVAVEPSDSTLLAGIALLDHRAGRFHRSLGEPPEATVLILDPGGRVDTVAFNAVDFRRVLARLAGVHREAFDRLEQGVRERDLAAIGAAATLSAVAHQAVLPSPLLEPAIELARRFGAVGVCRAHSGTIVGILLPPDGEDGGRIAQLRAALPVRVGVRRAALVGGGPRIATGPVRVAAGRAEEVA